ncbi:PLDc N-terminal domain-containing protein [Ancylomarina longa]|uniref:Cardiolipin synthase N-terminal domain-containing protein n=1 Tax=Ancylomarina longa TaxID=2487017 RepID=A0A434ATE5_9BACT|nr:PLDc N-terminal domain-containing protein [Ancylomarina longa]RUT77685.1 hypothetical protein DLK05_12220 [Ancylomarina longa]
MILSLVFDIWLIVSIIAIVLPALAIIDILRRDLLGINKLFWILVVLFAPLLGAIIYFYNRRTYKVRK